MLRICLASWLALGVVAIGCGSSEAEPTGDDDVPITDCDCRDTKHMSLECLCSKYLTCSTYEEAFDRAADCAGTNLIYRGCGFTQVRVSNGYTSTTHLYEGDDRVLVGVETAVDSPWGKCETGTYSTALVAIPADCAEITTCTRCGATALFPACEP